jgi:hypothetical protein
MEKILRIAPPQLCTGGIGKPCNRLTTFAIAEPISREYDRCFQLSPRCWEHGFAQLDEERQSIERFVIGHHRGKGKARVLKQVDVREVPRYRPDNPEHDKVMYIKERAWKVCYTDTAGKGRDVYVIWSYSRLSFLLRDPIRSQHRHKLKVSL